MRNNAIVYFSARTERQLDFSVSLLSLVLVLIYLHGNKLSRSDLFGTRLLSETQPSQQKHPCPVCSFQIVFLGPRLNNCTIICSLSPCRLALWYCIPFFSTLVIHCINIEHDDNWHNSFVSGFSASFTCSMHSHQLFQRHHSNPPEL